MGSRSGAKVLPQLPTLYLGLYAPLCVHGPKTMTLQQYESRRATALRGGPFFMSVFRRSQLSIADWSSKRYPDHYLYSSAH